MNKVPPRMCVHAKETRAAVNFESRSQNASWVSLRRKIIEPQGEAAARPAQPAERKALNLVVVGSSPTVGVSGPAPHAGEVGVPWSATDGGACAAKCNWRARWVALKCGKKIMTDWFCVVSELSNLWRAELIFWFGDSTCAAHAERPWPKCKC